MSTADELSQIRKIISNPLYRPWAREMTKRGKQVEPDGFPWKHLGLSDEDFLGLPLIYEESRKLIPMDHKKRLLNVLHAQQSRVIRWWQATLANTMKILGARVSIDKN